LFFYAPNDYLWNFTKGFLNIPMNNSQYIYETDTVPFLQIILNGYIDYFTPYMNVGFFSILSIYNEVNEALRNFRGYYLVNRIVLKEGVVKNTYDNEKSIIINYTNKEYKYNNIVINALSWKIINEGVNNHENKN